MIPPWLGGLLVAAVMVAGGSVTLGARAEEQAIREELDRLRAVAAGESPTEEGRTPPPGDTEGRGIGWESDESWLSTWEEARHGLEIEIVHFRPLPEQERESGRVYPIEFAVRANFAGVDEFLRRLGRLPAVRFPEWRLEREAGEAPAAAILRLEGRIVLHHRPPNLR